MLILNSWVYDYAKDILEKKVNQSNIKIPIFSDLQDRFEQLSNLVNLVIIIVIFVMIMFMIKMVS